jgi:hypothetical protein
MEPEVVVSSAYVRHMLARCGQTFTDDDWQRMWDQQPYDAKLTLLEMRGEQYARLTGVELTDGGNDGA